MTDDQWMTFDCFGTLLDWQSAFRRILRPVAGEMTDALVGGYHHVEPIVQREMQGAPYREILREGVRRAGEEAGVALTSSDLDLLIDQWHTIEAFPDTTDALKELHRQGWKLAVLTNCDRALFEPTHPNLGERMDLVITSEEVGSYKPRLGHFERFEQVTGVQRKNWVHSAVAWWHDMVPAHLLGLRCVWVNREKADHDASIVTKQVADMASLAKVSRELYDAS